MLIVFFGLRLLLGLFFMLTGAVKLAECHISAQVQAQMAQMVQFAEVLHLKAMGYNPDPMDLLIIVGWVELVSGLLLAIGPPLLQELSGILLTLLMIGTVYNLVLLKESVTTCAPPFLCLGLLLLLDTRGCQVL
ncbi:transmembrane protein 35B isoform X2 [Notamacropus eugenii]|uniref:transmembrane protein 35B isoform X2 n=1 Tax=Notamacropus eugenii TaxID=9315 RepID=UPI003B67C48F